MTHRQYIAWIAWLRLEQNEPSRNDYYLMQIATEVRRMFSKKPKDVKLNEFKLQFKESKKEPLTSTQANDYAKLRWLGAVGYTKKKPGT